MPLRLRSPFYRTPDVVTKDAPPATAPASSGSLVPLPQNPIPDNVPSTWTRVIMGPGQPITPWGYSFNGLSDREKELAELEPRTSQYLPNQNANIMPRIGAGLMPFSQLLWFNLNVPEPALFRRLRIAGLKDFVPQIIGPDGEVVQKARTATWRGADGLLHKTHTGDNEKQIAPDLAWLTTCPQPQLRQPAGKMTKYIYRDGSEKNAAVMVSDAPPSHVESTMLEEVQWTVARPDRYNAFPTWLSRFMFNAIVYDAACFYKIRDNAGHIIGLRVIDGSTIFLIIDERGETPPPPAPAYSQIIWGTPRNWFSTDQLWYRPQNLRAEAPPYGITPAEDGWLNVQFLNEFWQWWISEYMQGTMPRAWLKPPAGTTPEKATEYERMLDARQAHNYQMRARAHALLPGWEVTEAKSREFRGEEYNTARDQLALLYGVHPTELGRAPQGTGLTGSKGASEKGEEAHARIGINPDVSFIESAFNDVLLEMAEYDERLWGCTWQLSPGDTTIDPIKEEAKWIERWKSSLVRRNVVLNALHLESEPGPEGDEFYPVGKGGAGALGAPAAPDAGGQEEAADERQDAIPDGGEQAATIFYTNAKIGDVTKFETAWNVTPLLKHCGVCEEDDQYFGAPLSRETEVLFPQQGANETEIVAMVPANLDPRPALWKPEGGEKEELADAIGGPQYLREEAAYLLDRILDLRLVPLAYVGEIDGERGAAIMYVRGNEPRQDVTQYAPEYVEGAAVLDVVMSQADRLLHNWLTHPDDDTRPILIDNGLTFPTSPIVVGSVFVNAMRGQALSSGILARLRRSLGRLEWKDIEVLIGPEATDQARARVQTLITEGKIPE